MKKYKLIEKELETQILNNDFVTTGKLPTEAQLISRFSVSRQTVRRALSELELRGLIYKVQGGGTFVQNPENRQTAENSDSLFNKPMVAVMTAHISNYIFPPIISGIENVLNQNNVQLILSSTQDDSVIERKNLIQLLNDSSITGLIVEPTKSAFPSKNTDMYAALLRKGVKIVSIHSSLNTFQIPSFVMDDFSGGGQQAQSLLNNGHRNILGIFKTDDQQGQLRMAGAYSAIDQVDEHVDFRVLTFQSGHTEEEIGNYVKAIFTNDHDQRPTAIICYNDLCAISVIRALHELSIEIPNDVSIVSYDNSSLAHGLGLNLTGINHPKEKMGMDAASFLLKELSLKQPTEKKVQKKYPATLVMGNSIAPVTQNQH